MKSIWLQNKSIIAIAISVLALAEIVDLTIVSTAIPQIMGGLGANLNSIAMITTGYVVASAICIPLSGMLIRKLGMKQLVLMSATIFGVFSILCGTSTSLTEMVIFRILQGVGGAFLPALAQAYISENFKGKDNVTMMSMFSMVLVLGPIIGPIAGGFLCEQLSWPWIFFVNIPVCLIAIIVIFLFMKPTKGEQVKIDYVSFAFMVLGVGMIEYFIDEGNQHDWFQSFSMLTILAFGFIFLGFFIWRGLLGSSVVNFKLFKNTNFVLSCTLMFFCMTLLTALMAYFPTMLQQIYGFPVDIAGYISSPRGIASVLAAPIIGKILLKTDARYVLMSGIILLAVSSFMTAHFSPNHDDLLIMVVMLIQGFAMMATFLPIMQGAFIGIPLNQTGDASGVFNFFRNIGTSVGTSFSATAISRMKQINYHDLAVHVSPFSHGYASWSASVHVGGASALIGLANDEVLKQSSLLSYLDSYYLFGLCLLVILILPFFLKKASVGSNSAVMH